MKRRILSIIMAMAMTLSLMAVPAFAAEGDGTGNAVAQITVGETITPYNTAEAFRTAVSKLTGEATITLLSDVALTEGTSVSAATKKLTIPEESNVTLNLNKHTLTVGYRIEVKGNLTVDGNGTIASVSTSSTSSYAVFYVSADGKLALKSGTVNAAEGGYTLNVLSGATASVEGGILKGKINASVGTLKITGGQFATDISPYLGAGQGAVQENGYYSVSKTALTADTAAAEINGTYYATVVGALAAAKDDDTVTVLRNTTETAAVTCSGTNVTLDLNGKTVDMGAKKITVSGGLTIKDGLSNGKITGTADPLFSVSSFLTLESGKIETTEGSAVKTNSGSTFEMTGGTVQGSPAVDGYRGTVNITGGSVLADESGLLAIENDGAQITIGTTGATSHETPYIGGVDVGENTSVNLYSGTVTTVEGILSKDAAMTCRFTSDITDSLPAGKACVQEDDYWKVVELEEENAAAKIGNTFYASVTVAMSDMKDGDTLTLLKDYESSASKAIEITVENATLDLNGCDVTSSNGYGVYVKPSAATTFTLKNSGSKTSSIASTGDAALCATTNNSKKIVTIKVDGDINLTATGAEAIELGHARLAYSEDAAALVGNGGFKATTEDGEYIYASANAAINNDENKTAVLLNDYEGTSSITYSGTDGTVDLNGKTYTSSKAAVQLNNSNVGLTIKNGKLVGGADAEGIEIGVPPTAQEGKPQTVYSNISLTLDGVEVVSSPKTDGFGIVTNGNSESISVTLKNGSILTAPGAIGIYFPVTSGTLTIENSSITAGTGVAVKGGTVNISGDSVIHATGAKFAPTEALGSGVNSTGDAVYLEGNYDRNTTIKIEGGTFTSDNGYAVQMLFAEDAEDKTISISGGSFSSDPSAYVTEEYIALVENGQYVVQEKGENVQPAEVVAGTPDTTVSGVDKEDVEKVETAGNGIQPEGLPGEANAEASTNTVTADAGAAAINADKDIEGEDVEASAVTIVVQPYLQIEVTGYKTSEDTDTPNTMTLDITPMVRTVATTADLDNNEEIYLKTEVENQKNAVIMETGKEMNVTTPITLTIPLPDGFVTSENDKVYVQHKGYEYNTTVTKSGSGDSETYTATFTNPHGFSTFTISTESQTVATVGSDSYTNFQDAVNAAPNGATITIPSGASVPAEGLSATISGSSSKSIKVKNETGDKITVTINSVKQEIGANAISDAFTYTPSHGGSSGSSGYAITVPSNIKNGDVTVSPSRATAGTVVTITVKPDSGYELDSLTVTDKNGKTVALKDIGNNKYTFTMPSGAVKIAAEFVEETPVSTLPFDDVAATAWYYDAVEYVYDNGLMNGTASDTFAPNATLTRGMLATVLWRMEGSPVVNYALPFEDVSGDQWYTEAIRWAASVGVVNGTSATTYAPNANITREQLATMLYRYAAYKSGSVSTSASLSGFTDAGSVSDYAADAMEWAVAEEIIGGMTSTTLVPQGSATRAQTATMLMRYCENVL